MHTKIHIKLFCKSVDEERGKGIFEPKFCDTNIYINNNEVSKNELASSFKNGRVLLQELIKQHPEMRKLYDQSINTI